MGESYLAGTEYRDFNHKESILAEALESLKGGSWHVVLRNDEITILVESDLKVVDVLRRENRIETGHLTLDDVYFELVNDARVQVFFSVVQFREARIFHTSLTLQFDSYQWSFSAL